MKAVSLFDVFFDECVYGGTGVICGARFVKENKGEKRRDISPLAVGFESHPPHHCRGGSAPRPLVFFWGGVVWGVFRGFLGVWRCFRCSFGVVLLLFSY